MAVHSILHLFSVKLAMMIKIKLNHTIKMTLVIRKSK